MANDEKPEGSQLKSKEIGRYFTVPLKDLIPGKALNFDIHLFFKKNEHIIILNKKGDILISTLVQLWAERVEGSGTLDLDALVLIPASHLIRITEASVQYGTQGAYLFTYEDDAASGLGYSPTATDMALDVDPTGWYLPIDSGMVVVAGTRTAGQTLTDVLSVYFLYYPRWHSYRQEGAT